MPARADAHRPEFHRGNAWKAPVRAATTANITIATALNAGDILDGVTLAAGDRVLVKDQTTGSQNGIYDVAPTPVRSYDMDTGPEAWGCLVRVLAGTVNAGKTFGNTNTSLPTIGTTALTFAEVGAGGSALTVKDEGTNLTTGATSLDFVGPGVTATNVGGAVSVSISGSSAATPALVQSVATSQSINTAGETVTLGAAPTAGSVMFLSFAVEDATTQIASVTQTGATWARLYRDTLSGGGIEVWAGTGATGAGVTVVLSASQWHHFAVMEARGVAASLIGRTTYAIGTGAVSIPGGGVFAIYTARGYAGSGLGTFTSSPTFSVFVSGINGLSAALATATGTVAESSGQIASIAAIGAAPVAGDLNGVWDQSVAASTWSITHALGKNPSVTIVDSAGTTVVGQVQYIDISHITVTFAFPFSGKAYLN